MALQKAICVCRGGIRARENELFFPITKGQLMSFSVSPQMDLFPTKLNCAARTVGIYIITTTILLVFRSQKDTGGGALCTWKKIAKKDHHHQDIVFRAGSVFSRRLASGDAELTANRLSTITELMMGLAIFGADLTTASRYDGKKN